MTIEAANQSMRQARPDPAAAHAATRGDTTHTDHAAARKGFVLFAVFAAWLHSFFGTAEASQPRPGRLTEDQATGPEPLPTPAEIAGEAARANPAGDGAAPAQKTVAGPSAPATGAAPSPDAAGPDATGFAAPDPEGPALVWAPALPPAAPGMAAVSALPTAPVVAPDAPARTATPTPPRPDGPADPETPMPEETALDANLALLIASLDARLVGLDGLEVRQITDMLVGDVLREVPLAQLERMIALAGDNPTGVLGRVVEMLETPAARARGDSFAAADGSADEALSGNWPAAAPYSDEPMIDPALLAPVFL